MNNSEAWLRSVTSDAEGVVSRHIGIYQSTLSRQLRGDSLTPHSVVAIARFYDTNPIDGLIATRLITRDDLIHAYSASQLDKASNTDLIKELSRRLDAS